MIKGAATKFYGTRDILPAHPGPWCPGVTVASVRYLRLTTELSDLRPLIAE